MRITPVDTHKVDPTEVRRLDDLIATFPPTSEVGLVVRDVLQGIVWATVGRPDRSVTVTVDRREEEDTHRDGCERDGRTWEQHRAVDH